MSLADACPVCGSGGLSTFVRRERVPAHQNRIFRTQSSAAMAERGDLEMAICVSCGLVFNRAFSLGANLYGDFYDNTQTCSPSFRQYVSDLVDHIVVGKKIQNSTIAEVGCGQGSFLRDLITHPSSNNAGIGFDPSYDGPLSELDGRLRFERRYYGPDCLNEGVDVVVCRHVIEHVPAPTEFLLAVRGALVNTPQARVFFETPCVEWILRNRVIWDFFYEHCSLFSAVSLRNAFEYCGFAVSDVRHTFGGQYLWLEAGVSGGYERHSHPVEPLVALASEFSRAETDATRRWSETVRAHASRGKVAVWGAGAKGVTICNLIDPERTIIDCVVDVNPNKQGCFIPGSGHSIVAPMAVLQRGIDSVLLMNPNYRSEIETLLGKIGSTAELFL